jgi:hypothetical protein
MCINFLKIYKEGNSLMEDSMKKFALIAMLVVIAVVLVTCDMLVPPEATEEWTDVEYQIEGSVGQERVKSVKLYLQPDGMDRSVLPGPDTYGVRVSPEQKRIIRALSADTAAASHDFFEAVFTATAGNTVRTNWEIGHPAGVSGGLLTRPYNYAPLTASTVFVGRKANKTLLGVGWMTAVNDNDIANNTAGNITTTTWAVTYTIAPIKTWVGWEPTFNTDTPPAVTAWTFRERGSFYGETGTGSATFTTNGVGLGSPALTAMGSGKDFKPIPGSTVYYPLFNRPSTTTGDITTFTATYTIGGLTSLGNAGAPYAPTSTGTGEVASSVLAAIRVYGNWGTTSPRGGMQIIKRKPAYLFNGRTYEAGSIYDSFTTLSTGAAAAGIRSGTTVNQTADAQFVHIIPIGFNITNQSSGVFALTFQCPVYAITTTAATADPTNVFIKWFIRPADGPNLYLLDSGTDEGGMVMLGDTNAFSDDWIEIKTTGIGFQNN